MGTRVCKTRPPTALQEVACPTVPCSTAANSSGGGRFMVATLKETEKQDPDRVSSQRMSSTRREPLLLLLQYCCGAATGTNSRKTAPAYTCNSSPTDTGVDSRQVRRSRHPGVHLVITSSRPHWQISTLRSCVNRIYHTY